MTGYLLIGAVVAVVMGGGAWLAGRTEGPTQAFMMTGGAIALSVIAWMMLAEMLQLSESTPATSAIMVEMMALAIFSVRQHRTDWS